MAPQQIWKELLNIPGLEQTDKEKVKEQLWCHLKKRVQFTGIPLNQLSGKHIGEFAADFIKNGEGKEIWHSANFLGSIVYDEKEIRARIASVLNRFIAERREEFEALLLSADGQSPRIDVEHGVGGKNTNAVTKQKRPYKPRARTSQSINFVEDGASSRSHASPTVLKSSSKRSGDLTSANSEGANKRRATSTSMPPPSGVSLQSERENTVESFRSIPHDPPHSARATGQPRGSRSKASTPVSSPRVQQSFTSSTAAGAAAATSHTHNIGYTSVVQSPADDTADEGDRSVVVTIPAAEPLPSPTSDRSSTHPLTDNSVQEASPHTIAHTGIQGVRATGDSLAVVESAGKLFTVENLALIPEMLIDYLSECHDDRVISAARCEDPGRQGWLRAMSNLISDMRLDFETRINALAEGADRDRVAVTSYSRWAV